MQRRAQRGRASCTRKKRRVTRSEEFSAQDREAIYRVIASRRDVRKGFLSEDVPEDVLLRVLDAAHRAPSVGLSQPWRFIVVRDRPTREKVHGAFLEANARAAARYEGEQAAAYRALRLEGILSAPVNLCVVCDDDPQRGHGLGRQTMPETIRYSTVCAVQNLWLAARVEGLGVGWVSILEPDAVRSILGIPPKIAVVAYLCVGYVDAFAAEPDLVTAGWETSLPLAEVVDHERYGAG
jgi:5,6-dimethylbenzimidazole synthase